MGSGGKRAGAGRKLQFGEKTRVIRVPESKVADIRNYLKAKPSEMDFVPASHASRLALPLMGSSLSAGAAMTADNHIEGDLDLNDHLIRHPQDTFYARIRPDGDSMVDVGIFPGDMVIVDRKLRPTHNALVVAIINGSFNLKRFWNKDGQMRLLSENAAKAYAPIDFVEGDEMQIWGVVKHSIRYF